MPIELRKIKFERDVNKICVKASQFGFKVVHIATQNNIPTIWYETVPESPLTQDVEFRLLRSSSDIPDKSFHVGAVHINQAYWEGEVVWHVYQLY